MIPCGIEAIDALLNGSSTTPIQAADREGVGAAQALLIGHGFHSLPTMLASSYGMLGPQTTTALRAFQTANGLPVTGAIDGRTLQSLVTIPAPSPQISRAYAALVLDVAFTGLLPLATITMQFEGGGFFGAANLNTDKCGLSFGLIQWAQKPRRLQELLTAFQRADANRFVTILGGGDTAAADGLLTHTAKPSGGVDPLTGATTDARFDLIVEPWRTRFAAAGRDPVFHRAQIDAAVAAFTASARQIQVNVPNVVSERGLAFMLDVANQFGDGGAHSIAAAVARPGMTEAAFLEAAEVESVARVARQYGADSAEAKSTQNRREAIRTTAVLSNASVRV
jgi:peptidoglycan hydrolase-like protein with peptidoglycan-binding domain